MENLKGVPDGDLVVECGRPLSAETAGRIKDYVESALPGRKVIVLGDGLRLTPIDNRETLARIEHKLDQLLAALAGDEAEEAPAASLDDGRTFAMRDDRRGLG